MDDTGLPCRLFETGFEPTGKKRVNNYFNLRWIEVLKTALEDDDLAMLHASQFGKILQMGDHTFSVMFLHYLLSRQLVTEKDLQLWWLFVGKPIRYAIQDFALVTGLNCGEPPESRRPDNNKGCARGKVSGKGKSSSSSPSIWDVLFRGEEKPTTSWIMDRLVKGKRYKDPLTRLRLVLLVLVEGILCPTCGTTNIRSDVVSMLANLEEFLAYPWGRESFLLTVRSTKARSPSHYVLQDTMAIQGFTHAMVLVTVAACPSLLIKSGAVPQVDDEDRTSEEIVRSLIDMKLTVNFVTAKAVDQKGQAYVRSLLGSDEGDELLHDGMEDKEDAAVDRLLELITDDYPFEHNTWAGGVKADEVKVKKGHQIPAESIDGNGSSEAEDVTAGQQGGVDSGADSRERRGQSCMRPEDAPIGGPDISGGFSHLVPMFEMYMIRLKDHITTELGSLRKEVASSTASIAALELFVKNEFATIRNASSNNEHMYTEDPCGAYSPHMQPSPLGATFTDTQPAHGASVPMSTHDAGPQSYVATNGAERSSPCDELQPDPNIVVTDGFVELSNPTETTQEDIPIVGPDASGEVENPTPTLPSAQLSPPPSDPPRDASTESFVHVTESPIVPTTVPPTTAEAAAETTNPTIATTAEAAAGNTAETIVVEAGGLRGGVHQVASSGAGEESPATADTTPPVMDTTNIVEESVPLSPAPQELPSQPPISQPPFSPNSQPLHAFVQSGRGRHTSNTVPPDGFLRFSKRTRNSPDRYTPTEVTRKPEPNKRVRRALKDKGGKAICQPADPLPETTSFIGGFAPLMPPEPSKRTSFLHAMTIANKTPTVKGDSSHLVHLLAVFECTTVAPPQGLDQVIEFIRKRRDGLPDCRFDFLDTSFFSAVLRNFPEFNACPSKDAFTFSASLHQQFRSRPQWFTHVDVVYIPVLVGTTQWVGIIVDLNLWAMYVVDANKACPTAFALTSVLTPISILLPHLIGRFCATKRAQELNYAPLTMTRMDIPCLLEHPGCSAVVMLMLFELHAGCKELNSVSFTEEHARTAAENYAIETLHLSHGRSIPPPE
ncbi:hypothetical protein N665_0223s0027 [Sinapis alba]|nr:hypothetical protein N665_0223s0027 [Sinapis alba]